jgi:hypothetical protein
MLFPWVGMLEQIKLADAFVYYDDVQFSRGSFTNRVQVKTQDGIRWMTVPLKNFSIGQFIDGVSIQDLEMWRDRHLSILSQSFRGAPYAQDALEIAKQVYSVNYKSLGALARASMIALADYYGLLNGRRFIDIRELGIDGASSNRVLKVVLALKGTSYITGYGAFNYLKHEIFENTGIDVKYMNYRYEKYRQSWGDFTPYVTGLDLIANCGPKGIDKICSGTISWREFTSKT